MAFEIDGIHLTDREVDILAWLAKGQSNKQIARNLGISEGTVRAHLHNIQSKLKFSNRTRLAVWAVSKRIERLGASAAP
jgi:two-component system nitrate/nitrite response regulator NarL